jgi:4-amino-4-deoxy-L-arabinose transferase-like glycosyltransferase
MTIAAEQLEESRPAPAGRSARLLRGRSADPAWARPALLSLLVATALLYMVGLGRSGWANAFYSAAVQAGAKSWKAFFFGSFDSSSFITVDKPPASLWVMELSARLFGVNAWSILIPQALEGVAAVGVLYAVVRRWFTPAAGLLAGAALALTPVATLMFRFNNPDALLVLLLVLATWAVTRSLEHGSYRWLSLAAALVGFAFLTKMLQAFVVVPVFVLVYVWAAPVSLWRRLKHIALAAAALLVSAGWWVAIVELWPAASRPYIGGSQKNSVLELIFGYNGLGRLTGNETGSVVPGGVVPGGGTGTASAWGPTGWSRMFNSSWGGQVAWLLPAALAFFVVLLWLSRRAPRTDRTRAAALLWGGTLVLTAAVFSFSEGIIHEYYAVALAPGIGALVGIGAAALWARRRQIAWRLALAAIIAGTVVWAYVLLDRSATWQPWLRFTVFAGGLAAAALLIIADRLARRAATALACAGLAFALAGPAAYSLQTAATAHTGSLPSAGPAVAGGRGGFGRGGGFGGTRPAGGPFAGGTANGAAQATPPTGTTGGPGGFAGDGQPGANAAGGAAGGLLDASTPSAALTALLKTNAGRYTWAAATTGSQSAAGYQLATDLPVMSLGGFNGSDPYPTLAQFQALVRAGRVHYFIASGLGGGDGGGPGGSSSRSSIASWVASAYTSQTVGGITLYDLTSATASTASGS